MANVKPFEGVRYNLEKVVLKQVIAPPYDVISSDERELLTSKSVYNIVNVDFPGGDSDKYQKAAQTYNLWKDEQILTKDKKPGFYMYEQEYEYAGKSYVRTGFVGLLKLEEFGKGGVFPHEKTLSGPKEDRFALMCATKANLSQIFGLYIDPEDKLKSIFAECRAGMPAESAIDDDKVKHTIWAISDAEAVKQVQAMMKDKAIYIADGHHRYETALKYKETVRADNGDDPEETAPYDYIMMMFVNFYDPGLMLFPTHRLIDVPEDFDTETYMSKLKEKYTVEKLTTKEECDEYMANNTDVGTMVMIMPDGYYGISINSELLESLHPIYRQVDTYLLQKTIFNDILNIPEEQLLAKKGIHFYQKPEVLEKDVEKTGGIGFILKPVSIETMRLVSESGLVMPQKSTYFYPKLATGLLMNDL